MFDYKLITKAVAFSAIFLLLLIIGGILYPIIDSEICVNRISSKLHIKPSMSEIQNYIESSLKPGMNRVEVHEILENISPISVTEYYSSEKITTDQVVLKMCKFPLNNFVYLIDYSQDGKLIKIEYIFADE
jgi:hypothetical protein